MSHKIAIIAQQMLAENIPYLLGAEQLLQLRDEYGIYVNDPDFVVFVAVQKELEALRDAGVVVKLGADNAQLNESNTWAKEVSLAHCKSLVTRFTSE